MCLAVINIEAYSEVTHSSVKFSFESRILKDDDKIFWWLPRELRKNTLVIFPMSVCMSVFLCRFALCPYLTDRIWLYWFSWKLILGSFTKICQYRHILVKIRQNNGHLTQKHTHAFCAHLERYSLHIHRSEHYSKESCGAKLNTFYAKIKLSPEIVLVSR
jgi:hypothetical protein